MTDNNKDSQKPFKTEKVNNPGRKYAHLDKWIKLTGEMARAQAEAKGRYEVYIKNGQWVKEYPNGEIIPFSEEEND
ncbi:hypothetical protein [Gracilibacillus salinarum]|uniref:DUF2188 domain-containing protein n=1 Tax=Gracilibacillus salinarum TaxID=2932255 RepID=A0ABY4GT50_9BACI|nr:hypothetical protein [Gracilibacillus salinarum]UOQ87581.1 hypothetical protein MUN87_18520 [Gracilibacillus salinarum]